MELDDLLGADVSPEDFFEEKLPAFHRDRLEVFRRYVATPLIVSVHLTDLPRRYTYELAPDGVRYERGEMIDFPVLTLEGTTEHWEVVREHTLKLAKKAEPKIENRRPPRRVERDFIDALERHDGVFDIELLLPELDDAVDMRLVLNDYAPVDGAPEVDVRLPIHRLYEVADEERQLTEVARDLNLAGDFRLAWELGGLFISHFPELEE